MKRIDKLLCLFIAFFLIGTTASSIASAGSISVVNLAQLSGETTTYTNSIGMEFVLIPAGDFQMGSPEYEEGQEEYERPMHEVSIGQDYYLGMYEVTQEQWVEVMGYNPSYFKGNQNPVEMVSAYGAQAFINKLNEMEGTDKYRLPSEAEWEYACRAGTTTRFSFGDDESELGEYAWYPDNSGGITHPVGEKEPNPWGLYDMHGNIFEYCQDWEHSSYEGAPTDGSAWIEGGNPNGRVIRGGSIGQDLNFCRSAGRGFAYTPGPYKWYGFRVVMEKDVSETEVDDGVIIITPRVKYHLANGGFARELWVDHDGDGVYDEDIGFEDETGEYKSFGFGSWLSTYNEGAGNIYEGSVSNGDYSWEILEVSEDKAIVEFTNKFDHTTAKTRWEIYPNGDAKVTPWTLEPMDYTYGLGFTWCVSPQKDDVLGMRLSPDVEETSTVTFTGTSSEIICPAEGNWMIRPEGDFSDICFTNPYQFYQDKTHDYTCLIVEPKATSEDDWEWIECSEANDAIWGGRHSYDDPSNPLYYSAGLVDWCWFYDWSAEDGTMPGPCESPTTQPINQDQKFSFYVHWMWDDTTEAERYEAAGEIAEDLAQEKVVQDITFLTDAPEQEGSPIWTADGSKILFTLAGPSWDEAYSYVINADGTGKDRTGIGEGKLVGFSDLSPDGTELLVTKNLGNWWYDVYKVNINDGTQTPLAADPSRLEAWGAWSPDGTMIAYSQSGVSSGPTELWLMKADGIKHRIGASYNIGCIDWTPDGKIIYNAANSKEKPDLWMIDPDSEETTQLTDTPWGEWYSAVSPDGKYIVYSSDEGGIPDLWLRNMDGSYKVRLTYNIGIHDASPDWSPDGRKIAFEGHNPTNGVGDIAVMTLGDMFEVPVNNPPIADAGGPYEGYKDSPITFDASGSSDPNGDALQYRWDFDNDGVWDTEWSSNPMAEHMWADDQSGTWDNYIMLEVSDGELTATDSSEIKVLERKDYDPEISLPSWAPNSYEVYPGTSLSFVVKVENKGSKEDKINLVTEVSQSYVVYDDVDVSISKNFVSLLPGSSEIITLKITPKTDKHRIIEIKAISEGDASKSNTCYISTSSFNLHSLKNPFCFGFDYNSGETSHLSFDPQDSIQLSAENGNIRLYFNPTENQDYFKDFSVEISNENTGEFGEVHFELENGYNTVATGFDTSKNGYSIENYKNFWRRSLCYSMSETSMFFFNEQLLLPSGYTQVYELPESMAKSIIEEYFWESFRDNRRDTNSLLNDKISLTNQFAELKSNLQKSPVMISMLDPTVDAGHSVVVYGMAETDDRAYLLLYDNNNPYKDDNILESFKCAEFDKTSVQFSYFVSDDLGDITYTKFLVSDPQPPEDSDEFLFLVECPVNVTVIDENGRTVTDEGTNEIPGSEVVFIDEAKVFYLPSNLKYSIEINAYDSGIFSFTQIEYIENNLSMMKFKNISITSETRAIVEVRPNLIGNLMSIDYDGDGVVDEERKPDENIVLGTTSITDTTPPLSINSLSSNSESAWINWTWINPSDSDFNHTIVYLDGSFVSNVSETYFNATLLEQGSTHTISTRTVDLNGNINATWVNDTATTASNYDLIISDLTWIPSIFSDGQTVTFYSSIKNAGGDDVLRQFDVEFLIDGNVIGTKTIPSLLKDGIVEVSQTWTALAGVNNVSVKVDSGNQVLELNESNNIVLKNFSEVTELGERRILYVTYPETDLQNDSLYKGLIEEGFEVERCDFIPETETLNEYDLVIVRSYAAAWQQTADHIKEYVSNGGGVFICSGVPAFFPYSYPDHSLSSGFYDISYISEWFGTANYANVGVSDAFVSIDSPLGTELGIGDYLAHSPAWGGAAVSNLNPETTLKLAEWDYNGGGRIFAFTNEYQKGKVFYIATWGTENSSKLALVGAIWAAEDDYDENVTDTNRPPALDSIGNPSVNENETLEITLSATDEDGDNLTFSTDAEFGALVENVFTWTPDYNASGVYYVEFTVSDGELNDSKTAMITVNNVNRAPLLAPVGDREFDEGGELTVELSASDVDGDSLTFLTNVSFGDLENNIFTWKPGYSDSGTYGVKFTVSDGELNDSETITITVKDVNRAPEISLISPQNNSRIKDINQTIDLSIVDDNLDYVLYSHENSNFLLQPPYMINISNWKDGTHIIEVFAQDTDGLQSHSIYEFTIDFTNPDITKFYSFPTRPYSNDPITFFAQINDESEIDVSLEYSLDHGETYQSMDMIETSPSFYSAKIEPVDSQLTFVKSRVFVSDGENTEIKELFVPIRSNKVVLDFNYRSPLIDGILEPSDEWQMEKIDVNEIRFVNNDTLINNEQLDVSYSRNSTHLFSVFKINASEDAIINISGYFDSSATSILDTDTTDGFEISFNKDSVIELKDLVYGNQNWINDLQIGGDNNVIAESSYQSGSFTVEISKLFSSADNLDNNANHSRSLIIVDIFSNNAHEYLIWPGMTGSGFVPMDSGDIELFKGNSNTLAPKNWADIYFSNKLNLKIFEPNIYQAYLPVENISYSVSVYDIKQNLAKNAKVYATLINVNNSATILNFNSTDNLYRNEYLIPANTSIGIKYLKFNASDDFGNYGESNSYIYTLDSYIAKIEQNKTVILKNESILFNIYVSRPNAISTFLDDSEVDITSQVIDGNNITVIPEKQISSEIIGNMPVFSEIVDSTGLSNGIYTFKINISDSNGNLVERDTVFHIVENYSISLSTDEEVYERNTPVNISGFVQFDNGTYVSNEKINIDIIVKGFKRTFSTVTDETGFYTYEFIPFETEAGKYDLIVSTDVNGLIRKSDSNFTINGIVFDYLTTNVKMLKGTSSTIQLKIKNIGETTLNDVSLSVSDTNSADGVSANIIEYSPFILYGGEEKTINIQIDSLLSSPEQASFDLIASTVEGSKAHSSIFVSLSDGNPRIDIDPEIIKLNINPASSSVKTITISNTGYGILNNAQIVPPSQDWISVNRNLILGNILPGDSITFEALIYPSENTGTGRYIDNITLLSSNHPDMKIIFDVSIVSAHNGSITYHLIDKYLETNISSSKVTLISQDVEGLFFEKCSDDNGLVSFQEIPAGKYSYIVNAEKYDSMSGVVDIEPFESSADNNENQYLEVSLNPSWGLDIEWNVNETTTEDKYDITLNITMDAEVPIPILKAIPDHLSYTIIPGTEISDQTIDLYNLGLISVKNVKISTSTDQGIAIDLLSDSLSEIKAHEKTQIPFNISVDANAAHGVETTNYINISGEFLYRKNETEKMVSLNELSIPIYVYVPVGDFEVKPHNIVNILEPGQVYKSQFTVKNTGSAIEDIKLERNLGDNDISLVLDTTEIPVLDFGESKIISYTVSVPENYGWDRTIYNLINISGTESGTLTQVNSNVAIVVEIPNRIAQITGSHLEYTIEPGEHIDPNPVVAIRNSCYVDYNDKQVPITDIDISCSVIGTDNITVDSIMLEGSDELHIDLLDSGDEKNIFLQISSSASAIRGEKATILINYVGKYTDNNNEIREVTGHSTVDVTIPGKKLMVNPSSLAMGHTLDFSTYANPDTDEILPKVMSTYDRDTYSFTITNPHKEQVYLESPDVFFVQEILLGQIWGYAPTSVVWTSDESIDRNFLLSTAVHTVDLIVGGCSSMVENFGISWTIFDNGIYTKSNSAETDLSYGESTQLKVTGTSVYANLWPTIYDGAIYFGYNWENEEKRNCKIPVYVADIGLMGRMIYLSSTGDDGDDGDDDGPQIVGDLVNLPPNEQNEYKIDSGPKISEFTEARVKIQINQELTLEREAFEASAKLTNKLGTDLNDISISLNIEDENGTNSNDKFFIQSPTLANINSINGDGIIGSLETSSINWIIIPHTDSGGTAESGQKYCVQMHIEGTVNGKPFIADSEKANITVKPQPKLNLTYYLPKEIVADQPFHLAVKVNNSGYGWAKDLKIASAQPEIIENNAGLLLDFEISSSLKMDFGDIAPGEEKIKYWTLESSVPGRFSNFSATFTHSAELGGEQTSLIDEINTELLDREIVVDGLGIPHVVDSDNNNKPDLILDLLSGKEYALENPDVLSTSQDETNLTQSVLISKPRDQWICIEIPDIFDGTRTIERIYRSDGMILNPANYWITNNKVIILDDPEDSYTILYDSSSSVNNIPAAYDQSVTTYEDDYIEIVLSATDDDGDSLTYSIVTPPSNGSFTLTDNIVNYTPVQGYNGPDSFTFKANDGTDDSNTATVSIMVTGQVVDTELPEFESAFVFPANTTAGATIDIEVNATDNVGVAQITAGDTQLTKTDGIWQGSITAPNELGDYSLSITASDAAGNTAETSVPYHVVLLEGGADIAVSPRASNVVAGNNVSVGINVKNTQNIDDIFKIRINLDGVPESYWADLSGFGWTETDVQLRAGEEKTFPLEVEVPAGTSAGYRLFKVTVDSDTSSVYGFDTGYLIVS
ncbi:MAG: SUMF1/EgtB/PvdO family nonheme iron enzyme [Methanosarcinaceae archaeon]